MNAVNSNLKKQSVSGAFWTFVDLIINKGTYFFATILLARILGPQEFGLLGMIMLFVAIGNTLVDSGMSTSLLRSNDITELDYSTVFITNLVMSILVYTLLFLAAPYIALFYKQALLTDIIRCYCLGFVINAFRSIHHVKLMKAMQFRKITILNIPGNLLSLVVGVWMGYLGYGIWSLVVLFLVNQITATIIYWIFIRWKPRWEFDFVNYKNHLQFGYKLVLSAQLNTLFDNIYNVLIGKFYNVKVLGYYERAYTFNNYPVSILSGIILKVSLPSLASIKNDPLRLQQAYKSIMQMAFLISSIGLGLGAVIAEPLIVVVLGDQWLPVVPLFQVLCLSYVFYPIHSLNINILSIFGRSDLFLKLEVVKKAIILVVVAICFNFGVMGLVWSSVITSCLALIVNTHYSGRFLSYSTGKQLKDLLPTILIVGSSVFLIHLMQTLVNSSTPVIEIALSVIAGFILIVLLSEKARLTPYLHIKELILQQTKR